MKETINLIVKNQNKLFDEFGVSNNYQLKILNETTFSVINENDMHLVKYDENGSTTTNLILTKKDEPLIFEKDGYTMIIAIDCVKVALVFSNDNRVE